MRVADAMSGEILTARAHEGLAEVASRMVERWVGSSIVEPDEPGSAPGILTERDIVEVVAEGIDPGGARVADHHSPEATFAAPDWSLERAAHAMSEGGFRHLVVADGDPIGIISMRDVVRSWVDERWRHRTVQIREAMRRDVLEVDRSETLRETARLMVEHEQGAAIVKPPKAKAPPGLVTDREFLATVGHGRDPEVEQVADHLTGGMTFSAPDWSLRQAAEAMTKGGFQHIIVVDGGGTAGLLSMGDIVRRLLD